MQSVYCATSTSPALCDTARQLLFRRCPPWPVGLGPVAPCLQFPLVVSIFLLREMAAPRHRRLFRLGRCVKLRGGINAGVMLLKPSLDTLAHCLAEVF